MSNNNFLIKCLKFVTYALGFPLMLALLIGFLIPITQDAVLGDYAKNWIIIMFAVWAIIAIAEVIIMKFYGNKNEKNHTIASLVLTVLTLVLVIVPVESTNAKVMEQYNAEKQAVEKEYGVTLDSYKKVQGWARPVTGAGTSAQSFVADVNAFMAKYKLTSLNSFDLGHYDSDTKKGHIVGVYEKLDLLIAQKKEAEKQLVVSEAKIVELEASILTIKEKIDAITYELNLLKADASQKVEDYDVAYNDYKNIKPTLVDALNKAKEEKVIAQNKLDEAKVALGDGSGSQEDVSKAEQALAEKVAQENAIKQNIDELEVEKNAKYDAKNNAISKVNDAQSKLDAKQTELVNTEKELVKYKGHRVVLKEHKEEIFNFLKAIVNDIDVILPDGVGIDFPNILDGFKLADLSENFELIKELLNTNPDKILDMIPDEYLEFTYGFNKESVPYCNSQINGSLTEMSLAEVEKLNVEINNFPEIITLGIVRFVVYICAGLVVISIIVYENIKFKQIKEAKHE